MNERSHIWALSQTFVASASVALAFFVPAVASATNLNVLQTVSVDGASMHAGDTVTRDNFTSLTNFWAFTFAWPYSVPNSRAGLVVFRGTFGNLEGGAPVSGVNYGLQVQAWGAGTTTISKQYSLPMLGDLGTVSGTYTAVVADFSTVPDMYNKFIEWFATGGAQGNEPNHYSFLTFAYDATSTPTALPGALASVQYGQQVITGGAEVLQETVTPNQNNPSQFWRFNFTWPNAVSNQNALLMVFRGTYGALEGGAPVSGVNYGSTVQAWAAGNNNLGKFMSLPGLEAVGAEGTYTVLVAERDSKFSGNSTAQEALWFASGGAEGVAPRKYTTLTFTLTNPPECCSSVLFLPGIMGSRLYDPVQKRWEPTNEADVQELYLDQNGNSIRNDIVAFEALDTYNGPGPINPDIYKSFLADLGDVEANEIIADYVAFAYDWRLSIPDILADGELESQLRALAAGSHTDKVTIVAHSNGGLLAKALLNELGSEAASLVDSLVLVAVPQLGTPQAIGALLHGYDSGILTQYSEARARDFAHNSPFAYHLLPHHDYFSGSGYSITSPLVTFAQGASTAPFINEYGQTIDTIGELERFVRGDEGRQAPTYADLYNPAVASQYLLTLANQYLDPIDSDWEAPPGITVHQVAGVGEQTLTGIAYRDGYTSCAVWKSGQSSTPQCLEYFNGLLYTPLTALDGDGTVVTPSALAMSESDQAQRWWVDLKEFNADELGLLSNIRFLRTKHGDLLEVPDVRALILDEILASDPQQYTYVSNVQPNIEEENRLEFTLHSPLDMWLVDSFGNEVSSTTSGISGASYNRYGEVQVISVPKNTPVSLRMQGLALGIFTLEVEEYSSGSLVGTVAFAGVPTTDSTTVLFDLPTATVAEAQALEVDYESDGTPDLVLEPTLNETVIPDVTPPITEVTLSGTEGANGWYKSSVDAVLTAEDEGSGVSETWYSLDDGAFTQGTSTTVSSEGVHTLRYYSVDHQGNVEDEKVQQIQIDSTAPDVVLSASTVTNDLLVTGSDAQSAVLVSTVGTTTTLTDEAGNTTVLGFKKAYTGTRLTYARLESVQYNAETPIPLPSSFAFIWDKAGVLTSQTLVADSQFIVQAFYDKKRNKTSIVVLKKNTPIKVTTLPGLVLAKLTLSSGQVQYSW